MAMQDWIHHYPGVQALVHGRGDRLFYRPDDAPVFPPPAEPSPLSMGLNSLAFPGDTTRPLAICAYRGETPPHTWTHEDIRSELYAAVLAEQLEVPAYLVLFTPPHGLQRWRTIRLSVCGL